MGEGPAAAADLLGLQLEAAVVGLLTSWRRSSDAQPRPRRIAIVPIPAGVRVEIGIPPKPLGAVHFGVMFGIMLLALWAAGEEGLATADDFFSLVVLLLLAAAFLAGLLWHVAAREVVTIDITRVRVGLEIPFVGRGLRFAKAYDRRLVRNLRYEPSIGSDVPLLPFLGRTLYRQAPRNVCFEAGARTVRFGIDLDEADAGRVIAAWSARFPVPRTPLPDRP